MSQQQDAKDGDGYQPPPSTANIVELEQRMLEADVIMATAAKIPTINLEQTTDNSLALKAYGPLSAAIKRGYCIMEAIKTTLQAYKQEESNMRTAFQDQEADDLREAIDNENPTAKIQQLYASIMDWEALIGTYDLMRDFEGLAPFKKAVPPPASSSSIVAAGPNPVVAKKEYLKMEAPKPKKFGGRKGGSFKNFIVSFNLAYPDDRFEKQVKMIELMNLVEGEAADWLQNLEFTEEDYDLAMDLLTAAYGEATMQAFEISEARSQLT